MKPLQFTDVKSIIVRMPNWIGDMVMATPVISDVRKAYPKARITVMCRAPACDLLKEDPEIDELFCFSKSSKFTRRSDRKNIIERVRQGKYDLGILLTNSFSSSWFFWQGKVKHRIGFGGDGRWLLLNHPVSCPENVDRQHLVRIYKAVLSPLGISISNTPPRLFLLEKEIELAKQLLLRHGVDSGKVLVGINPGAAYGSAKCWLPERFRAVAEKLLENKDASIVFFGDYSTVPMIKDICQDLGPRVINLAGHTSLREVAALIKLCDVLLTNDSGPMHIADALGTRVIALFGSTSEIVTGPYQSGKVIHKHVQCSPCFRRICPIDFRCMKQIEVEEVYQAILENLKAYV